MEFLDDFWHNIESGFTGCVRCFCADFCWSIFLIAGAYLWCLRHTAHALAGVRHGQDGRATHGRDAHVTNNFRAAFSGLGEGI